MRVCILGCGVMGSGIVSLLAKSALVTEILWWGRDLSSVESSLHKVSIELTRYAKKNALTSQTMENILAKIHCCTELRETANYDIYLEAIVEELEAKMTLLSALSAFIPKHALVASNTSSLSITALAMKLTIPANFIGIHFFNPTSVMQLVEVVKGLTTSSESTAQAIALIEQLGKKPVLVNESPGFIVNRMLIPMINEAVAILAEGVASKVDIDNAMKFGANHPIGPLALADLIGNDVCLSIMETLHHETGDSKYRAHPLLRQYVRAGLLGRKVKCGFYEY